MSFSLNMETIAAIICFLLLFLFIMVLYMRSKGTENIIKKVIKGTSASAHWNSVGWSFTRDAEFLKSLIDSYSERTFQLEQLAASNKFGLNKPASIKDEQMNEIVSTVSNSIWKQLGDDYVELLSYYMGSREKIQIYIVNEVHRIILARVNKYNEFSVRNKFHSNRRQKLPQ